MTFYFRINQ
ncbi:unnamed protein product [Acanthoscelides obtectus]|uniref:Uncharacterized protein n=1 Tax=Acanthoscelides obtectus TaxID=200917 RepID=A0A9P0LSI1_ACAOB|nr:unnamed protein product [Acanthoscelides obtectus]CAK1628305.1 hypothetical protein AOBTE_LOCUS5124 [Acanthoscelides obtectus]